uniref:G protein-coupled receptor n=1 Tax=Pristionchus pacificus TaxID=54126 RepID=A0A8R1YYE3_PRIPA
MFLTNFLCREDMDRFFPLFEIISSIELIFIMLTLISSLVVIATVIKSSKLNRLVNNFQLHYLTSIIVRLHLAIGIIIACIYVSSRVAVMHHQFLGPSHYVETIPLILGSLMKEIFLGYMTMLISVLSLDRWVATKAWAWYESSPPSTLIFFAVQELILFSISLPLSYLLISECITGMQSAYCLCVIVIIGTILFVLVYQLNLREIREIKRGAVIHRYSISRTYQIRENIASFAKLFKPMVIVSIPPMIFYPIFELVPPNIGFDGIRFFSVAMYDLWLAIASCVVISCLPIFFPQLKQSLNQFRFLKKVNKIRASSLQSTSIAAEKIELQNTFKKYSNPREASDIYFSLLSNDLFGK